MKMLLKSLYHRSCFSFYLFRILYFVVFVLSRLYNVLSFSIRTRSLWLYFSISEILLIRVPTISVITFWTVCWPFVKFLELKFFITFYLIDLKFLLDLPTEIVVKFFCFDFSLNYLIFYLFFFYKFYSVLHVSFFLFPYFYTY